MRQRGLFIVLEGIEGAGKTTQMRFITQWMQSQNLPLEVTREPGGTTLAEDIRSLLLDPTQNGMNPQAELLLIFAARSDHLKRRIEPALASGKHVLCDRFTDTSFAYQGGGRGLPLPWIEQLEQQVQGALRPDLVLLLDLPAKLGLERAGRRSQADRFESERVEFFERARQTYLSRAKSEPTRYRIIDASQAPDSVSRHISHVLTESFT